MANEKEYNFCKAYMEPDEYILWKGRPGKGNLLSSGDAYMIPFSIIWCAFAVFWEMSVIRSDAPFFFALFGGLFVFMGLYLCFGRFILITQMRKQTYYVITNKKIIRLSGKRIDMLSAAALPPSRTIIHKDGNGTIRFGTENPYYKWGFRETFTLTGTEIGGFSLENIPDVIQVQQAINSMNK